MTDLSEGRQQTSLKSIQRVEINYNDKEDRVELTMILEDSRGSSTFLYRKHCQNPEYLTTFLRRYCDILLKGVEDDRPNRN